MREQVIKLLEQAGISREIAEKALEVPKEKSLGDYAFPCFVLAKERKQKPADIAVHIVNSLASDIHPEFESINSSGPYVNFFVNRQSLTEEVISNVLKQKAKYGTSKIGKGKNYIIEFSSPNIAKPFGIGHLRSTIIGNSLSQLARAQGYNVKTINYLGDWGTPVGKILASYSQYGDAKVLKDNPVKHLYELYVKASQDSNFEEQGRQWFKRLSEGDKSVVSQWKKWRAISISSFNEIYKKLGVSFDVITGESTYEKSIPVVEKLLAKSNLLIESEGAQIVDLEQYGLGVCLIRKKDGATLYATRDIAAAIDRYKKYKFDSLIYEVGAEQKLHFKQVFKVLELLGNEWAKNCLHIYHGFYLDTDGKKFATRQGKSVLMQEIFDDVENLASQEVKQRSKISEKELKKRAETITRAAILYGDLKNTKTNDMVFDMKRCVSFEGDTGPYLLYTYARAKSILRKVKTPKTKPFIPTITELERSLIIHLSQFPEAVTHAHSQQAPHLIAQYAYKLAQTFNEFYHSLPVKDVPETAFRLRLVASSSQVLKNALSLLGISVLEEM